ncbi:MAG: TraB/GumN family protein [Hyphomicrobiaceae bacterium]
MAAHAKTDEACRGKDLLAELKINSPQSHAAIMAAADKIPNGEAILWKVERDGLPTSYLFGTVHLTDPRAQQFSDQMLGALAMSKYLALEVADLTPEKTSQAIAASAKSVLFTDGKRLDKLLDSKEYAFVAQTLKKSGMPTGLAPLFKPWIVTMIMSVPDCERKKVAKGELVVDMRLGQEARRLGIEVVGLETIESQLSAMAAVPLQDQLQILRASLKYMKQTNDLSETVLQLYLARRISATLPFQAALARRVGINPDVYKSFTRELLTKRNLRMRNKIISMLEKNSTFVAVGALHLPGDTGLVNILRQAGFKLTAME